MISQPITALILAGGQGSRLQGADKGLLTLGNRERFAERLSTLFRQHHFPVFISCNRNAATYTGLADRVFADTLPGFHGPLQGILAAREYLETPWLLVTPCDTPLLDHRYPDRMTADLSPDSKPVLRVAHDGRRLQNLHVLLHRDQLDLLSDYLNAGGKSVYGWLDRTGHEPVDFSDCPDLFRNVNTPEDLEALSLQARPARGS